MTKYLDLHYLILLKANNIKIFIEISVLYLECLDVSLFEISIAKFHEFMDLTFYERRFTYNSLSQQHLDKMNSVI